MTLRSRYWADLSALDFARQQASGEAARCIALLPVAATEQHGPHLPLSVDTVLAQGVLAAAMPHLPEALNVLVLPTQTVGLSGAHTFCRHPDTEKRDDSSAVDRHCRIGGGSRHPQTGVVQHAWRQCGCDGPGGA